jgi:hypothetical protein
VSPHCYAIHAHHRLVHTAHSLVVYHDARCGYSPVLVTYTTNHRNNDGIKEFEAKDMLSPGFREHWKAPGQSLSLIRASSTHILRGRTLSASLPYLSLASMRYEYRTPHISCLIRLGCRLRAPRLLFSEFQSYPLSCCTTINSSL